MTFNEQEFNWKEALWEIRQELSALTERVNNELCHQLRFNRWLLGVFASIIVGLTILFLRYILST